MGFTSKVANVVKGAIANTVSGLQSGSNNQVQKKKIAAKKIPIIHSLETILLS